MRARTRVWIEDSAGDVVYGPGRHRTLQAIRDLGSLQAAARHLGLSYRGIWGRLRLSERRLGFALVESRPGRGAHAGTRLTPKGARLLEAYEAVAQEICRATERAFAERLLPVLSEDRPK